MQDTTGNSCRRVGARIPNARDKSAYGECNNRYRTLLSRSAMRVCHPGPVAFQRSITSVGTRSEISLRGFGENGRPPLFILERASISSVNSGSSSYSSACTVCASTRTRSDFKERRDAGLFAFICFLGCGTDSTCSLLGAFALVVHVSGAAFCATYQVSC